MGLLSKLFGNKLAAPAPTQVSKIDVQEAEMERARNQVFAQINEIVREHAATLLRKRNMLVSRDDYGNVLTEKWDSEVKYFINSVLLQYTNLDSLFNRAFYCHTQDDKEYFFTGEINGLLDKIECNSFPDFDRNILSAIEHATPEEFEQLCGALLSKYGWNVVQTGGTGDHGADLIAERMGLRVAFQCKKYGTPVGNSAVQEVLAGKVMHSAHLAAVIATRGFTNSARELAQAGNVYLLGATDLVNFHTILGVE